MSLKGIIIYSGTKKGAKPLAPKTQTIINQRNTTNNTSDANIGYLGILRLTDY